MYSHIIYNCERENNNYHDTGKWMHTKKKKIAKGSLTPKFLDSTNAFYSLLVVSVCVCVHMHMHKREMRHDVRLILGKYVQWNVML